MVPLVITLWSIVMSLQAFQCGAEQTDKECFDVDCQPGMTMSCSQPVNLNSCRGNSTINVNLATDVFIYQRDTSDGRVRQCDSTGRDCPYDHTDPLNYTVTDALPSVDGQKTCQGSNYCVVMFYSKSPLKTTSTCEGRHYVYVNYTCVNATETSDTVSLQSADITGLIAGLVAAFFVSSVCETLEML